MYMQDNDIRNQNTVVCEGIIKELLPIGNAKKCEKLKKILLKNLSLVKKVYRRAENFSETRSYVSEPFLWLCDNFSFIEEEYLISLDSISKQKATLCKNGLPLSYLTALKLLRLTDGKLNESNVFSLIHAFDRTVKGGMDFDDREAFPVFIKCAVLSYLGEITHDLSEKDGVFGKDDGGDRMINAIKSLKELSVMDHSESFAETVLEKTLTKDPSGAYPDMSEESRFYLRYKIHIEAKRKKLSDAEYAALLLDEAEKKDCYIGCDTEKENPYAKYYFPALYTSAFIISLVLSLFTSIFLLPFFFFPTIEAIKPLSEIICAKLLKTSGAVPSLKLESIPDDAKTLCVITSLLRGEAFDKELFSKLERIYNANSGKNIKFGLLCDLSDYSAATSAEDEKIISYASGRIDSLNAKYKNSFILFIRPRSYSKSEKCFMAYERKRGAVIELTKLIKTGVSSFDQSISSLSENRTFIADVKYVITLDADTNLGIDTAKELVGRMMHPQNTPVTDKKKRKVISGYGIMQPKMSTELDGAQKTPFSRLMCDSGGVDIYSGASFELYQSLFGEGIFCGKGIFDVNAFYETITASEIFPDDRILSHDILEGERLRTALLSDIELTDGFPKNELSYLKRKHRWIRGDIQNIPFLNKKYGFSPLSKYKILDNVRRVLTPIISLFLILLSVFLPEKYGTVIFFCAFSPYIMPFIIDSVNIVLKLSLKSAARRFFSKGVTVGIWQSFLRMLFFEAMLAKDGFMSLGATITSLYRMFFTKRKMLEWVTAAQSDSGKTDAALFITKHIGSCIVGAILFVFAPSGLIKLAGFAFFIMPFAAYFTSKNKKTVAKRDTKEPAKLKGYAVDIWRFFDENVNDKENHLPPDNIQFLPYEKTAHRTSPTNIGLYLVSVLCARDLGFIDTDEMYYRISHTVNTVEKLKKWKGHLYNWYDTQKLFVLSPNYVSSVDSGNFIACLITLKNGLFDYTGEEPKLVETVKKITDIIENTDISALYNDKRHLFYVGAEISDKVVYDKSCYDLFMSESRILSYIAASSRTVPKKHFRRLARPLITADGYIGLSSWSGTAFEYFMPALFMPVKKGSMLYEAMVFAYKAQTSMRIGKEKLWGISESAYFAFDCDLNYQYKAFGVPILGRTSDNKKQSVISPYSTFLSLCVSEKEVCENLSKLEKLGVYGKYGFYEAVDFTPSRVKNSHAIVKSYMSHHLGMSLLAITNAINDKSVTARFMMDGAMACGNELLEEKIPVNAVIKKMRKTSSSHFPTEAPRLDERSVSKDFSYSKPLCACISEGKSTCIISDCGHVSFAKGNTLLNYATFKKQFCEMPETLSCYLKLDGRIVGMTPLSKLPDKDCRFTFSHGESSAEHSVSCEKGSFSLEYTVSVQKYSPIRLKFSGKSEAKEVKLCFSFTPCLNSKKAYESHPAFSELFTEAFFDKEENILFYKKRQRSQSDEDMVLAVAYADRSQKVFFSTRRKYGLQNKSIYDPFLLFEEADMKTGACINPYCAYGTDISDKRSAELILVLTHSIKSAKEAVCAERDFGFEKAKAALCDVSAQFALGAGISSLGSCKTVSEMLSDAIFGRTDDYQNRYLKKLFLARETEISINSLWKHGISGDHPIITIDTGNYFFASPIEKRIRAFKLLTMKNLRCDLVILYSETDRYERKVEKKLVSLVYSCGAQGYLGRNKGGIHIIDKAALGDNICALRFISSSYSNVYYESTNAKNEKAFQKALLPVISSQPCDIPKDGYKVNNGCFEKDCFVTDKTQSIKAPMAHVLSGENISTVITEGSLGYTFYKNASERRITPYSENGNSDFSGEKLFLSVNGVLFDLAQCSSYVKYYSDRAEYYGKAASTSYKITLYCSHKLPAKIIQTEIKSEGSSKIKLIFCIKPCMGRTPVKNAVYKKNNDTLVFTNPLSEGFSSYFGFVKLFCKNDSFCTLNICNTAQEDFKNTEAALSDSLCVGCDIKNGKNTCTFVLGAEKTGCDISELLGKEPENTFKEALGHTKSFCDSLLPQITFEPSGKSDAAKSLEVMFNRYLAHSCIFSRMLARSGFYQSGGAYGFRDQLQDCLMLLYSDKSRAFTHICRAAAHQFKEGDVLHWWHTQGKKGVRTTCSDDYLWLVYVMCEYEKLSGELAFLGTVIPYIEGDKLDKNENEKYIPFSNSPIKESLYLHAVRALDRACELIGEHGLSLMGCCDWCDGYSSVGKDKKGESTFTTMFLIMNLLHFSDICAKLSDTEREMKYKSFSQKLISSLMKYGYDSTNGYFIRGYYDDGSPFGSIECEEGKIDLIPQSFAVLCGMPDDISASSLKKAYDELFDKEYGIMKLLTPSFDKSKKNPGYIKGYIPGVRENGGQYTHAALFFALSCFELSDRLYEKDQASSEKYAAMGGEILMYSNPAFRSGNGVKSVIKDSYITEPYSVAADIYSAPDHIGRGGWTHYTGASGWFYRLILNYVFGVQIFDTDTKKPYIIINAKRSFPLCDITDGGALDFKEYGFDLHILYIKDGKKRVTSGGKIIEDGKIFKDVKKIEVHI